MRILLEGVTTYGLVLGEAGENPVVSLEAVSDGPDEPMHVRLWVDDSSVCIFDADELERAMAYCMSEKLALDRMRDESHQLSKERGTDG